MHQQTGRNFGFFDHSADVLAQFYASWVRGIFITCAKGEGLSSNKAFLGVSVVVAMIAFAGFFYWSKATTTEPSHQVGAADSQLLVRSHSPTKGSDDAKVTVVEFLDPECEACRAMHPIVKRLLTEYDGKIRLVIRYMPFHGNSVLAASALEEAREFGKFDEALDKLFENQPAWADHANPKPELIAGYLKELGIEDDKLDAAYLTSKHSSKVEVDGADGMKLGVTRTPTFFVNGRILSEIGYDPLKEAIERALNE